MKKALILSIVMLFVAGAALAASGKAVMPYFWSSAGAYKASPVIFCAHNPNTAGGTADVTLNWYKSGSTSPDQTNSINFTGPGHQRFDWTGTAAVGFVTVSWTSYDCGSVGCTGVEWYGAAGSLYHVPFVQ